MKKILGLTVAALMIMALVGTGTWAYFSDPETSTGNALTAGKLDLLVDGADSPVTLFSVSAKQPGEVGNGSLTLKNDGDFAAELDISVGSITNTGFTGASEFADDSGDLGGVCLVAAYIDVDQNAAWSTGDRGLKSDGTSFAHVADVTGTADSGTTTTLVDVALTQVDDFFNGMLLTITGGTGSGESRWITDFVAASDTVTVTSAFSVALDATSAYKIENLLYATIDSHDSTSWDNVYGGTMAAAAEDDFIVLWRLPTSAGNNIQGDLASFGITFTLEQTAAD